MYWRKNSRSVNAIQLLICFHFVFINLSLFFSFPFSLFSFVFSLFHNFFPGSLSDSPKYEGYIHEVCLVSYTLNTGQFPLLPNMSQDCQQS